VMYLPLDGKINVGLAVNKNIKTRIIEAGEEKVWAQTSANGWATEMPGLSDFMFEFGQIVAKCEGALPFIAEMENQPIATGTLFVYDDTALLAGASTVPEGRR